MAKENCTYCTLDTPSHELAYDEDKPVALSMISSAGGTWHITGISNYGYNSVAIRYCPFCGRDLLDDVKFEPIAQRLYDKYGWKKGDSENNA